MSDSNKNNTVLALLAGGVVGAAAAALLLNRAAKSRPKASHPKIHVLLVNISFKSTEERSQWANWWRPLAAQVYANEPNCLSYEMSFAVDDPCAAIIYERYVSKADLDGPHQETLGGFVASASTPPESTKTLTHFTETNIGHMDR